MELDLNHVNYNMHDWEYTLTVLPKVTVKQNKDLQLSSDFLELFSQSDFLFFSFQTKLLERFAQ